MRYDLASLSPDQRRMILVASDGKYNELISSVDFGKIFKKLLVPFSGTYTFFFGAATAASEYLSPRSANSGLQTLPECKGIYNKCKMLLQVAGDITHRSFTRGEIPIPHLPPDEAARLFRFDVGHPADGSAYVLNPCLDRHYLLPALANERLAQEKLAAFISINSDLGAKKIEILSASLMEKSRKMKMESNILEAAAQVGLSSYVDANGIVSKQVYMEFDKPKKSPSVPEDCNIWLNTDPVLRALVNARINQRVRIFQMNFKFSELIDVGEKVCAEIAGRGINVGGEYHTVKTSTWNFLVEYWPSEN